MIISVRDFDHQELFAAEILDYMVQENLIFDIVIPYAQYPNATNISATDLLKIQVTTDRINYQGYGRIFETFPSEGQGTLLRIKFDGHYDIQ